MESLVKPSHEPGPPWARTDSAWLSRLRRSGWQGWTLMAGGDDVMDQSILFWREGKATTRNLCLTLRVREHRDQHVREQLSDLTQMTEPHEEDTKWPRKQIVAGELHPLHRNWTLNAGTALDPVIPRPGTPNSFRIRYLPYEKARTNSAPYSAQGCLIMTLDGAEGTGHEVTAMLNVLKKQIGLDTRLSTASDLEYVYQRKMAWALRLPLSEVDSQIHPRDSVETRLSVMTRFLSRHMGVADVTRLPDYDWKPRFHSAFNPWANVVGTGEAGWPYWLRFDMGEHLPALRGRYLLGHDLSLQSTQVGDSIARMLRTTAHLLSAEERWLRLGTPSQSIHTAQGEPGQAYLKLRILPDENDATLVFDIDLLRRVDHILIPASSPRTALSPETLQTRLTIESVARGTPCNVYLKRAISLLDSLVRINVDSEADRAKILEAFRLVDVPQVGTRTVETLVRVRRT